MINKEIIVDGTGHIAGKLGTYIAKKLLEGYTITVLCAESIVLTGPIHRTKLRYKDYLNKRCLVNPLRGPFHYKEPSKLFMRLVKRMVPYKKKRGAAALQRLQVFEGIPEKFENTERSICPRALLEYCANPIRKSATYGKLLSEFGWKHLNITEEMKKKVLQREEKAKKEKDARMEEIQRIRESSSFNKEVEEIMSRIE
uniref:uL13 n=1 Tax=Paranosema locustae TaxID=235221 RepID=UPI00187D6DC5|nr:Chain LO0, uL13 [Paranosema locustae]|eukprot:jgi/Antlo1/2043/629